MPPERAPTEARSRRGCRHRSSSRSRCCRANRGRGSRAPASLAFEAKSSGLDGVVVSGDDVQDVRAVCGDEFCLVVPGIRPAGGNGHDQVRVLTPAAAIESGADYIVVGRPITGANDPVGVAEGILREVR